MPVAQKLGYIGLGVQAQKGTAVAPTKFIKFVGDTKISPEQAYTMHWEGGMGLDPGVSLKESQKYDPNFNCFARPDIAGFLFAMLLGVDTKTGAADPYTHTITPHASTIPWLTLERQILGWTMVERVVDAKMKQIEVSGEATKPVSLACQLAGISGTQEASPTSATYETSMPFVFFQGTYTVDAAATALIKDFRITVANELGEDIFTTGTIRADIPLLARKVSGQFTMLFDSAAHYKKVLYGGAGDTIQKILAEGSIDISLDYIEATKARQLKITIPEIYHTKAPAELNAEPGILAVQCEFEAKKGTNPLLTVVAQNATAAAYV